MLTRGVWNKPEPSLKHWKTPVAHEPLYLVSVPVFSIVFSIMFISSPLFFFPLATQSNSGILYFGDTKPLQGESARPPNTKYTLILFIIHIYIHKIYIYILCVCVRIFTTWGGEAFNVTGRDHWVLVISSNHLHCVAVWCSAGCFSSKWNGKASASLTEAGIESLLAPALQGHKTLTTRLSIGDSNEWDHTPDISKR